MKRKLRLALYIVSAFALLPVDMSAKKEILNDKDSLFTARYVFENIEPSSLEIIPKSIRLDMLDYWDVDSVFKASNIMGGLSWLNELTPEYLKVTITPVSSLEIRILPFKESKIALTVYTVGDVPEAADSQLKFYDDNLRELDSKDFFEIPRIKDFFEIPKGSSTKMKEIEEMIPFPTIAYSANALSDNIEARLTVAQYISEDDWNIAKLFLKPFITFEWKKNKYKLEK